MKQLIIITCQTNEPFLTPPKKSMSLSPVEVLQGEGNISIRFNQSLGNVSRYLNQQFGIPDDSPPKQPEEEDE